jgi:arylsulfatase
MDILPTVAGLCNAPLPKNALDGIDILPLLTGARPQLDREALLYFDNLHLQCARLGKWKLHVARHNSAAYSPAPPGGRRNLPLHQPELYDLIADPAESYDAAPENPAVVADIRGRIDKLMAGMPAEIQEAWRTAQAIRVNQHPTGQHPRPAPE